MATELLAWCVLLAAGVVVGWEAHRMLQRHPMSGRQSLLFGLNYLLTRLLWRAEVVGSMDLLPGQGAILVCNHRAPVDPTFLYLSTRRVVHWMVAKEYCVHPALAWFFQITESIPVSRGGIDTKATKTAIRYAQAGDLVGMFPEGRINTTDEVLLPGRPGAAMIALRARVPVIPMYVEGSPFDGSVYTCLFMPAKVRLTIGKPLDLSDYYDRAADRATHREVTIRLLREIAKLAGQPNFRPRLSGGKKYETEPLLPSEIG